MKICIDAGHNCSDYDTGASGNGLKEQDVTFEIADKLKKLLAETSVSVIMTRSKLTDNVGKNAKDSINERARIANREKCDYFISVHCNAGGGTGTETLIYGTGGNAEFLAKSVNDKIVNRFGLRDRGVKVRSDLGVLRLTNMPAILVETAFIDNKSDALLLKNNTDGFAKAIFEGISEVLGFSAEVSAKKFTEPEEITEKLSETIEITDKKSAVEAIAKAKAENSSLYWILYKIVN